MQCWFKKMLPGMVWATKLPALRWVSTDAHDIVVHEGTEWRAAFFRLFNYIDGTNSENTKIPMTKPVTARYISCQDKSLLEKSRNVNIDMYIHMKSNYDWPFAHLRQPRIQGYWLNHWIKLFGRIIPGEGPNCGSNFTMSFLVPEKFQVKLLR